MTDTLKQVTERLERQLEETPELDFVRSTTTPGMTTIFVNLKSSVKANQVQERWQKARNLIGDMRHTLPAGVVGRMPSRVAPRMLW
jgi:multidrug efflux pump subunit AcrB